ncbi:MAG TPA: FimV/HubP family polar landmark protein [Steroidobacteraceae bacterium]|nr:FimV/HubP family polar landmark protein [Steroidobacteraceae bacterium]
MRAQIELLSATPEELENLQVGLASQETFERYGLDRPYYLQDLSFEVVRSGSSDGNYIRISSSRPMTEPFLTFLVEAMWSRGRLLREYTVLLDPPTFAPPPAQATQPAVTAPQRSTPSDSGRIERPVETRPAPAAEMPAARPRPMPAPAAEREAEPAPAPKPQAGEPDLPFDAASGEDLVVQRGQTLWGIASRLRPDFRLTMNQTMLAIYEANPEAFGGNINILRAGSRLRIPSADDIYRIDRGYALNEAKRHHAQWSGAPAPAPAAREPVATTTRPSLQLVPPDDEPAGIGTGAELPDDAETTAAEPVESLREQEILDRIAELEAADVPEQRSLIEIRDNELAALRQQLAEIRGELYEPEAFEPEGFDAATAEDELAAEDELLAEPEEADVAASAAEDAADTTIQPPSNVITSSTRPEPSLLDKIIGVATNTWVLIIAGALLLAGAVLFWFVRRGRGEDDEEWSNSAMAGRDLDETALSSTEALRAPSRGDESIVVVEQRRAGVSPLDEDTLDAPGPEQDLGARTTEIGALASMEDTFSSETAVNLDQSDPVAEADFHMAYGLYDQAADLVNGALESDPENVDLLTKLCEIYFVWGNRDAFVDAARRVQQVAAGGEAGEWDKIVIMGKQIAADDALFAGAGVAGATRAVDLSFDSDSDDAGALDMDFGAAYEGGGEVIDLGGDGEDIFDFSATDETAEEVIDLGGAKDSGGDADKDDEGVDFVFEEEPARKQSAADSGVVDFDFDAEEAGDDGTAGMPGAQGSRGTPTIEEQFSGFDATSELPSIPDAADESGARRAPSSDETAEINLDELGLDVDALEETELASLDDFDNFDDFDETDDDDVTASQKILDQTGLNRALEDSTEATGRNPAVDPDSTGVRGRFDADDTSLNEALDIDDSLSATGRMRLAPDETGQNPLLQRVDEATDVDFDESLLEATGRTQILPEDFAVETSTRDDGGVIADEAETLLASFDDDDDDQDETVLARTLNEEANFDFARTEALPPDVFTGNMDLDETGEMPAVASTDFDLDLDDLTAALKVSEMGDTVDMPRDDATVEHVRPGFDDFDETSEVPTMSLSPEDMSDDLHEARTMTEVGTKLDLARAYVDMGDPGGARSILEEVLDEGDDSQRQQARQLLESLPG